MRTLREINADIDVAESRSDLDAMLTLADEMATIGTIEAQAEAYKNRGVAFGRRGEYEASLEHSMRSMSLYESLGDHAQVARLFVNMGNVFNANGDYAKALEHYNRALVLFEELGDKKGLISSLVNVGMIFVHLADYPTALDNYHRSLVLAEEMSDVMVVATIYSNLGAVYSGTRDHTQALDHYKRALKVFEDAGSRQEVAIVLENIGTVLDGHGEHRQALEYFTRSIAINRELGNPLRIAHVMGNMIRTLLELGQDDDAARLLDEQLALAGRNQIVLIGHHANRAALAVRRQDLETAHAELLSSLSHATDSSRRADIAHCHQLLRDLAQQRNDFAGYIEHNNEYTRISEEIRGKQATQRVAALESDRKLQAERAERDRERALLHSALPKFVAERMIRGEDVTGDHYDNAAVMFIDIVGFTAHTSHVPPNDVVKMLENIFSTIDGICDTYNVVKVKTIGDSYMCFAHEGNGELGMGNSPEQRVAAVALAIQQSEFYWPREASPEGSHEDSLDRLTFRIGIHRGPVTAGVIGTQRLQYDVWGDTVNVASRMESSGEPGRIHVSEAFASFLGLRPRNDSSPLPHDVRNDSSSAVDGEGRDVIPNEVRNEEPGTWHVALRGATELKGKGTMTTYWLESP